MNRSLILAAALSCVMGSASMAQDYARSAQSNASVQEFVRRAGTSGLAEVEMGELGAKKAKNGQVEAFAKRMVADHTKANQELLTAIKGKGVQVPSSRTDTHKAMVEKFRAAGCGQEFRPRLHGADGRAPRGRYRTVRDRSGRREIRSRPASLWKRTLPTLQDHLKQAQTIRSELAD